MTWLLLCLALVLIGAALIMRRRTGLPWQRVVFSDTGGWRRPSDPLIARRYGLVGKPDYLMARGRELIPVEVKPGRQAREPYLSDIMQLAAYCLLVEEASGVRPRYGLLRYAHTTFRIPFDARLRDKLVMLLEEMRLADQDVSAARSHDQPARCAACGFVAQCDEALP
jgi:CRISPR-associated exonuclease Cas4